MPEIDWDRVPGTEITFPRPIDGFAKGVMSRRNYERDTWAVQLCPGRRGVFHGSQQDWTGRWQELQYQVDESEKVISFLTADLVRLQEAGLITLPTRETDIEGLARALNEGLADAARAERRALRQDHPRGSAADPQPGDNPGDSCR